MRSKKNTNKRSSLINKVRKLTGLTGRKHPSAYWGTRLSIENLESRDLLSAVTFQQGVSGYAGTEDTILYNRSPNVNFGTESFLSIDQQDINGVRQGLLKFGNVFGSGAGQIPVGSTINSATLRLNVLDPSNTSMQISLYRMLDNWSESTATWNTFGAIGGVQASEGEAAGLPPDVTQFDASLGPKILDVKRSLEHWAAGEGNFGWLIESAATNGWDFETSEAAQANRPLLTVDFTPPTPAAAGVAQFLNVTPRVTEGNADNTVMLDVARSGGVTGALDVNYTITAGTAGAGDVVITSGTVSFAGGVATAAIPIQLKGDGSLEGNEQFTVTLTGAVGANSVATVTIADDDALINEVVANISNATVNETDREYIELIGTPGASLTGYYFVIFEGEYDGTATTTPPSDPYGTADVVVDLTGVTFGANGLVVLTPTNWLYTADPQTTRVNIPQLDLAGSPGTTAPGGRLEDSSQTYALWRSPTNAFVQGTDYDTVGVFEVATELAIGTGVGILDGLPAGAQLVDSVGVVEGGGGDRDRVLTTSDLNHPGVHVHIPTGLASSEGVTSDAVSRRFNTTNEEDTQPNSIGVWFNGDVPNGAATPIQYAADPSRSVVAPLGAVVTPGAHNILRNVFFSVAATSVDEAAGTVTLTVQRSGDTTGAINVGYSTSNETAIAGQDYTAVVGGNLFFGVGDDSENITITINTDSNAEGFESFRVNLATATSPFLITTGTAIVTINDANVNVRTFQDGVAGYNGTDDSYLDSRQPIDPSGFNASVVVSQEIETAAVATASRPSQGLLKFNDLFGSGVNQVPQGAEIFNAFITVNVVDPSAADAQIRLFRMLNVWDEATATWASPAVNGTITNGVTPDGVEADSIVDAVVGTPGASGLVNIALNVDTIQAWANGTLTNLGWSLVNNSADDWSFGSSNDFLSQNPILPKLTILYTDPVVASPGEFSLSNSNFTVNENGTASVTVNRIGGSSGSATVNYTIGAGTGSLADITGSATGSIEFGPGELFETITIPINNDALLESNETLSVTIAGTGLNFDRSNATLTVRDNDFNTTTPSLLLNEFYINSPGNDGAHEFIELAGTPLSGLGSLYYIAVDGDVGPTEGSAEFVVDLGGALNGSNGSTLIAAQTGFDFTVPAGTNYIGRSDLNAEGLRNGTGTFILLYSPERTLTLGDFDYDWDNTAGGGMLDLPAGVQIIDLISIRDASATDVTYGPAGSVIAELDHPNYHADALSRIRGNTSRQTASAWFHGDLTESGDDPLVYNQLPGFSTGLPSPGSAVTPGEVNVSTPAVSPLVSLTSVTPNAPVGTVTLNFTAPITQALKGTGNGDRGVTLTDQAGIAVPDVDVAAVVAGLGTNTLTLSFTGPAVTGGLLPAGNYRLRFLGNGLIGNGRAVDAANLGTVGGSNRDFLFSVAAPPVTNADFDTDGDVDGADFLTWQRGLGTPAANLADGDADNDDDVDGTDLGVWQTQFGSGSLVAAAETSSTPGDFASQLPRGAWLTMPESLAAKRLPSVDYAAEAFAGLVEDAAVGSVGIGAWESLGDDEDSFGDLFATGDDESSDFDAAFDEWPGVLAAV